MIEDYISKIKKVTSNRKSKISNSIGMNEAYRFYKKNCGKLTSQEFRKSIHLINLALQESIARGEDLTIPQKMGELQLRKFNTNIDFKDGKLITNLPIDWKRTLELWSEDKQAEKETQRRLLGSKNQRIICLTERYKDCIDTWFNSSETKTMEVSFADKIVINGDAV